MKWNNIPLELQRVNAWCFCVGDKIPMYFDGKNCHKSNVNKPNTRMTFDACVQYATKLRQEGKDAHIGFILSKDDPYVCIDMDIKDITNEKDQAKWTTIEQYNRITRIVEDFDTYSELSKSGKGLHVWCKGNTLKGCRRDGIELYSNQRFIICTGNSINNKPIEDRTELVALLYSQLEVETIRTYVELEEIEEEFSDVEVIEKASNAYNGQKYVDLCNGNWKKYGYPSQSEADLALMAMLCFYTTSNEQCRRLFRASVLGKREKATRDNRYLNYMIQLRRTVQKGMEDIDISQFQKGLQQIELANQESPLLHVPSAQATNIISPTPATSLALTTPDILDDNVPYDGMQWPPGLAGKIAKYVYQTSKRPIREISIVATLGMLAGICGKSWHIPDSGLNMYIVILAKSAIGKEDLHGGISKFMSAVAGRQPASWQFIKFSEYASGQALQKECATSQSFCTVSGEWGRKLKRFTDDRGDGPMSSLRTTMTNLYQKSGPRSVVGGIAYSNADKNVAAVNGVAFSMVGEATPVQYYNALTESMMEDGFLSRFLTVEYNGPRPRLNNLAFTEPPHALADSVADLCTHALTLLSRQQSTPVDRTSQASEMLAKFEIECDDTINATDDESQRQMWNRASLKVMRISALLAVCDNHLTPVIQEQHVTWALDVVNRDINIMKRRFETGDIGSGDQARMKKVIFILKEYLRNGAAASHKIPKEMYEAAIVTRRMLQKRTYQAPTFSNHKNGSAYALDMTLKNLIDDGYIVPVNDAELVKKYDYHGKCFRIIGVL